MRSFFFLRTIEIYLVSTNLPIFHTHLHLTTTKQKKQCYIVFGLHKTNKTPYSQERAKLQLFLYSICQWLRIIASIREILRSSGFTIPTAKSQRERPPLFSVLRVQFLTPMFFRSSSPDSNHLNLGFPTRRVPFDLRRVSFLEGFSSCILKRCTSHLNLPILTTLTRSISS